MSRPLILLGLLLLAAPAYGQGPFPVNQWSQYGTGAWDQAIWRVGDNGGAYPYDKLLQGDGTFVTMSPNGITLGNYRGQRGGQDTPWHTWWSGVWDSSRKRYLAIMGSGDQTESSNEVNEWGWATGTWNPNGRPVNPTTRLIVPNLVNWPSAYLIDPTDPGGPPAVIDVHNDYPANVKTAQNGLNLYPLGRETYGGIVYMPSVQRVWLWSGFGDWQSGSSPYLMAEYDPVAKKYEVITTADGNAFGGGAFHGEAMPTATWDATNNRVLFLNSDGLWSYTPTAAYGSRTACLVGSCDGSPYQTRYGHTPTLLWDSKRQWLVAIGGDTFFDATKLVRWDFSGGLTNPSVTQVPITGTFALALGPEGPGALYDPVGDRYVVWAGGTTLYYINPDTAASTPFTPSAGSDPSNITTDSDRGPGPHGLGYGIWGRFWYIAGDDVYATLNFGTQQGVFVFKPSRAGSVPVLSSLSPTSALQGGPAFTLTVTGANFVSASVVQWNGSPRTTTFVSNTKLTASIPASDLTAAGFASVKVFNPGSGGGTSNALTFTITPAVTLVVTGNPGSGPYAVEARTTLPGALTVKFVVDGSFFHQESVAKYCLFGGDAACATGTLGAGAHAIKAQVLAQGTTTVLAETQITVTEGSPPVTLVVTGNPGSGPYAVEAQTTLPGALTVNFFVDGALFHQESVAKYCLFGGDATCATGTRGAGTHVIKAQVLAQGTTTVLAETQITVTEGSPPVTLVVTGNPGSGPYAVEAQTTLPGALTVNFFVDGALFHQESVAKYCLFGGDATCATGTRGAGTHVIKAQVLAQGTTTVLAETQITVTEGS